MSIQALPTLPTPPDPASDSKAEFLAKAQAFTTAQKRFGDSLNGEAIPAINAAIATINDFTPHLQAIHAAPDYASSAAASAVNSASSADRAENSVRDASLQVGKAADEAIIATEMARRAAASAASASAVSGLPVLDPDAAGRAIIVGPDGKQWVLSESTLGTSSVRVYAYADRGQLRDVVDAKQGDVAVVRGLGLFDFVPASTEPDDDETAFAAQGGVWLLQAVSLDAAISYIKPMIDENSWFAVRKIAATVTVVAASTSATIVSDGNVGIEGGEMMFVVPPAGASNKLIFRAYSDYWRRVKIDITNTSASSQSVPSGDISVIVFYIGEQQ